MQGEAKGEGHDMGSGTVKGASIALRRWEDWERSRLRKLKRDEKRRQDMARAFPNGYGYPQSNGLLRADMRSQYTEGSDTLSMTSSSDDDQWGEQIGGYNEHSAQYPPPPVGVSMPSKEMIQSAEVVDGNTMAAMLENGFDDRPPSFSNRVSNSSSSSQQRQRYQLIDGPISPQSGPPSPMFVNPHAHQPMGSYDIAQVPLRQYPSPISPTRAVGASSSAVDWRTHVKKRSTGTGPARYGPLGPLDPNN